MKWGVVVLSMAAIIAVSACNKKAAPAPPPPPPPAAAPTASLTANPASIQQGQASTLSWTTQNATDVTLQGNRVGPSGSQTVTPSASTTYRLTAKGDGGTQEATARVTVTPAAPPVVSAPSTSDQELFASSMQDVYFDYDKYDIRPSEQPKLQADADFLKSHPNISFTIEGHCDERGSTEYNLALGDNRANAVKQALVNLGVPAASIKTISYGKEKPSCTGHDEACWQQNRRGHFVYGQ
jgi:peptidoglycan-associated lipoprotein